MRPLPLCTLCVAAAALLATLPSAVAEFLIYDRNAIGSGEIWRLLSGHLVHFTSSHLLMDLFAFVVSGSLIEHERRGDCGWLYLSMGAAISGALWSLDPLLDRFGGLSGLAYGNVAFLALLVLHRRKSGGVLPAVLLAALSLKLFIDLLYSVGPPAGFVSQPFATVPLAHLTGVLVAAAYFVLTTKEYRHVAA